MFEHIEGNPHAAFAESLRVIKPGGYAVHTTCFINPIHNHPGDYWRFTPDGLANLAKGKAKVLEVAGWGNALAWPYVFLGLRHVPIPRAKWHPLHWLATYNQHNWPISTWIIARKL